MTTLLVVTAVDAEAAAVVAALGTAQDVTMGALPGWRLQTVLGPVDVLAGGVGVAAAAAAAAFALTARRYELVLSAGIAGGFPPTVPGDVVVADAVVHADLGAEDGPSFRALSQLGFGDERTPLDPATAVELARRCGGRTGAVLSVSTVTGTATTARRRLEQSPDARAEAMEGAGILAAARLAGVVFAEVRTISNAVGPRDRATWDIPLALRALGAAIAAITSTEWTL